MGALRAFAALMLVCATPALATAPAVAAVAADPVTRWRPLIAEASIRFGVPAAWIERVMRAESRGLTHLDGQPITSRAGAMGLMQLMPATWAAMRDRYALGSDPHDPRDNILAGTAFLRLLYDRFGYPGLFAAYNVGPSRYARHLAKGDLLPAETRQYMTIVAATAHEPERTPVAADRSLFFVRNTTGTSAEASEPASNSSVPDR